MDQLTSVNIAAWLAVAAFLVGLVNGVLKLTDRAKPKEPVPPLHEQFPSQSAVKELRARLISLEEREQACRQHIADAYATKVELERIERNREQWRVEVNEKLDELLQRTAHMVGYGKGN